MVWTASNVVLIPKELAPGVYAIYPDDAHAKKRGRLSGGHLGWICRRNNGVLV